MKTIIKGATLVYGSGLKREDMLIGNGKIEAIKQSIRATGDERIVDGTSFYALPGFLAGAREDVECIEQSGVTTFVRRLAKGGDLNRSNQSEAYPYDYVYQGSLERPSAAMLEDWQKMRVKVANATTEVVQSIDWRYWLPKFKRFGIVLEMETSDRVLPSISELPLILPFAGQRKRPRPRTVLKVSQSMIPAWERIANKQDPLLYSGYWLDALQYELPRLTKESEAEAFLIRMVKSRASIPAKIFGVYPQKGSLTVGADADILLVSKENLMTSGGESFKPDQIWTLGEAIDERRGKKIAGRLLDRHRTYAYSY